MASSQSKLFNILLRLINKKAFLGKQLKSGIRGWYQCPEPPYRIAKNCQVQKFQINGRNVFTLQPKNKDCHKHILYLHGGAYVQSFVWFHWEFMSRLVKDGNCCFTAPDYPLAPSHTYLDSFDMVILVYKRMLTITDPDNLIIMGDSAGGGFALALAQKLREEGIQQPARIILLSPWLDLNLTNPDIDHIDSKDPFLEKVSLKRAGQLYAGGNPPDHYLLSPINGSMEGLGLISIFIGSRDILVADARKFCRMAKEKGVEIDYNEFADMVHAWMFLNFPESKTAKKQILELIRDQ